MVPSHNVTLILVENETLTKASYNSKWFSLSGITIKKVLM
jgi:DNA polymerase III delta subunit